MQLFTMKTVAILLLAALMSAPAAAQASRSYSGPAGMGAGLGGMLGVGLPVPGEGAGNSDLGRSGVGSTLKTVIAQLNAGQLQTVDVGGQAFAVSLVAQRQVADVTASSSPSNVVTLVNALLAGGVGRGPASDVAKGLTVLGTSRGSYGALVQTAQAYNAAVGTLGQGAQAPAALLAVRAALLPLLAASK